MRTTGRVLAVVLGCLLMGVPMSVRADNPDRTAYDAGTNADAGSTAAGAMPLAYGTYNAMLTAGDTDWFAFPASTASACIRLEITSAADADATLQVATGSQTRSFPLHIPAGTTLRAAIAATSADRVLVSARDVGTILPNQPMGYRFTVSSLSSTALGAGDAFTSSDAPGSLASSWNAPSECFGGALTTLSDVLDIHDVYAIQVPAGSALAISLASPAGRVTLLDASGAAVSPTVSGGVMAVTSALPGGTYFLDVSRTSSADSSYLVGAVLTDPGNPCRPQC